VEPDVLRPELHILARAVVRQGDAVLLARAKGYANSFLPGGHLEPGESLKASLARELREELGLEAEVGVYLGAIEHEWGDPPKTHYELNHLFEVSLPTLASSTHVVPSREAHLTFFWAEAGSLARQQLEPYPLQNLLKNAAPNPLALWASTLHDGKL